MFETPRLSSAQPDGPPVSEIARKVRGSFTLSDRALTILAPMFRRLPYSTTVGGRAAPSQSARPTREYSLPAGLIRAIDGNWLAPWMWSTDFGYFGRLN